MGPTGLCTTRTNVILYHHEICLILYFNTAIHIEAEVPGSIYSDLRRNKILNQHPYYEKNDVNYRWVAYDNWTYIKNFISKKLLRLITSTKFTLKYFSISRLA